MKFTKGEKVRFYLNKPKDSSAITMYDGYVQEVKGLLKNKYLVVTSDEKQCVVLPASHITPLGLTSTPLYLHKAIVLNKILAVIIIVLVAVLIVGGIKLAKIDRQLNDTNNVSPNNQYIQLEKSSHQLI